MKTLIENSTNLSKYIFDDDCVITIESDKVKCHDFVILDMNADNCYLVEVTSIPEDWAIDKYNHNNGWVLNENWKNPDIQIGEQ